MTIPVFLFALGVLAAFTAGSTVTMVVNQDGHSVAVVCLLWWNWVLFGASFLSAFEMGSSGVSLAIGLAGMTVAAISYVHPDLTLLAGAGLWFVLSILYMAAAGHLVRFVVTQWRILRGKKGARVNPRADAEASRQGSVAGHRPLPDAGEPRQAPLFPERIAKPTSDPTGRLGLAAASKQKMSAAEEEAAARKKREENILTKPDRGVSMGIKQGSGGSGE